ncbi:MAG: methylated-DNA--[protein]-cysteine S-methyltransferase [Bacillota bacterium]|nr:methylated-DNA--[protein]-cysteine S-methyltransferase [Bacillota bacterium]
MKCTLNLDTPLGKMFLEGDDRYITALRFGELEEDCPSPILCMAEKQLGEYFAGSRKEFELPLNPRGTEFQKSVWNALLEIPYGETASYGEIAAKIGNPKASRAVGMANNRNPIAIIIPCHRVIGAGGKLTGYAGGLDKKEFLLKLEKKGVEL